MYGPQSFCSTEFANLLWPLREAVGYEAAVGGDNHPIDGCRIYLVFLQVLVGAIEVARLSLITICRHIWMFNKPLEVWNLNSLTILDKFFFIQILERKRSLSCSPRTLAPLSVLQFLTSSVVAPVLSRLVYLLSMVILRRSGNCLSLKYNPFVITIHDLCF